MSTDQTSTGPTVVVTINATIDPAAWRTEYALSPDADVTADVREYFTGYDTPWGGFPSFMADLVTGDPGMSVTVESPDETAARRARNSEIAEAIADGTLDRRHAAYRRALARFNRASAQVAKALGDMDEEDEREYGDLPELTLSRADEYRADAWEDLADTAMSLLSTLGYDDDETATETDR